MNLASQTEHSTHSPQQHLLQTGSQQAESLLDWGGLSTGDEGRPPNQPMAIAAPRGHGGRRLLGGGVLWVVGRGAHRWTSLPFAWCEAQAPGRRPRWQAAPPPKRAASRQALGSHQRRGASTARTVAHRARNLHRSAPPGHPPQRKDVRELSPREREMCLDYVLILL